MPSVYRFSTSTTAQGTNVTGLNYVAGGYTIAFWAKGPTSNAGDVFRQASTANAARDGYYIGFASNELQIRHFTAASTFSRQPISASPQRENIWKHYAVTFDGTGVVSGYLNGNLVLNVTLTSIPTANASCTTTLTPGTNGTYTGLLFDFQIILGASVPGQNIKKLMDPTVVNPNLKARYFGREFVGVGASGILRDESGNGNNLTTPATTGRLDIGEEPPIRPTFA